MRVHVNDVGPDRDMHRDRNLEAPRRGGDADRANGGFARARILRRPTGRAQPRRDALVDRAFSCVPVSSAMPNVPGPSVASTSSEVPPDSAISKSWMMPAPLVAMAETNPRSIRSTSTGLSPVLVDLMERGFVSAIATNGAGIIHDFEIALSGGTSEDVDEALGPGVRHGGRDRHAAESRDQRGVARVSGSGSRSEVSLAAQAGVRANQRRRRRGASRFRSRCTWPSAPTSFTCTRRPPGAAIGEGSLRDFRYFASCGRATAGGVYLNCGSAVVLPEVFLKAVAVARNQGRSLDGLTTVNLDFLRHYRPQTNVRDAPDGRNGRGYSLTGHHEIMIPLLAAALDRAR